MDIQNSILINKYKSIGPISVETFLKLKDPIFYVDESFNNDNNFSIIFNSKSDTKIYIQDDIDDRKEIIGEYLLYYDNFIEGYNFIEVHYLGRIYLKYFYVKSAKALGETGIIKIRNVIEEISPGLSIDYSDKSLEKIVIANHFKNCDKIKVTYLVNNYKKIITSMDNIKIKPIQTLSKEIKTSSIVRKQNNKAINLEIRKCNSIKHYTQKSIEEINNQENSMLFFTLLYIKKYMNVIYNNYRFEFNSLINDLETIERYKNNKKYYNELVNACINKINLIKEYNSKILSLINKNDDLINSLGLNSLNVQNRNVTARLLKNPAYSYMLDLYKLISAQYIDFLFEKGLLNRTVSFKKSPLLFEIYTYCLIKNIFNDNGYYYKNNDEEKPSFLGRFINDDNRVDVYYNTDAIHIDDFEENNEDYGLVSVKKREKNTNIHTTPDLVVLIFNNKNELIKSFVIEVKCRKTNNVMNEEVLGQIRDYTLLKYIDETTKKVNSINEVICVYPYDDNSGYEKLIQKKYEYITYIALEINGNLKNDFGYNYLKDKLLS